MIKAQLIIDSRRATTKGYPIKIEIYSGRKYKYLGLNKYQKTKKLKLTSDLIKRMSSLEEEVSYCNANNLSLEDSIKVIKNGVNDKELEIFLLKKRLNELRKETGIGILEFMELRIQELKDIKRSTEAYERTKTQISYFIGDDQDVRINDIDYEWLQEFIRYKTKFGKGKGNVTFLLKTLRATYKEAQRRDSLNIKKGNPFTGLIVNSKSSIAPDITVEDFKKLLQFEPKPYSTRKSIFVTKRHINLTLFQFSIGGHDYADIACLKWSNIKNGRIKFKRYKNKSKPDGGSLVDNKLSDFALSMIEEYGDKNNERIFSHIPHPTAPNYKKRRDNANESLSRVCVGLKLTEKIKTKTPRYLFRSFAGELLIDTLVIMQLQGHKPDGVTYKYQRKLSHEVIDKEHQKVLDLIFAKSI
ncbi:phage integrase SAM-like domain-containing protein [Aquimarina sp. 2201CG5-10]|uniref:phage integrase SAM-like domain-containing protein n=1 Tax=Aquimarina callyspongiae TaxID=3098150 RepID=UPI002AB51697|nr:phage integrase SAM-like domain-containing protein [Aquimarina sp. 2201CG5-10]MDY8137547.1 phage integrase SAM-like domain-containing protein [Aquimarina sp. 2201CG5-10]